ncbi:DUF5682 family protein [Streptomyces sp. DH12]|uniref:DUF5682 family protein n=1 Tax=Streptomyces sp. DH12 TaxID=2857010 RepID=UPI001E640F87|nr:DUF5682 family protein [Streptomyces sp. DH12]
MRGPLLLGVRHHGPGSARAVRAALDAARPAAVLIEGPPEADALLPLAADPATRPPVALLAHAVDEPGRAAFWPFAAFSPEWVALRWALDHGAAVHFADLPAAHSLAMMGDPTWSDDDSEESDDSDGSGDTGGPEGAAGGGAPATGRRRGPRVDPLAALAEAAGYDDAERWWEDVVEHRASYGGDPFGPFAAVAEAMAALRGAYGHGGHARDPVREAYMRLRLRAARKEHGDDAVAFVCGAWHVPALAAKATVTADRALLRGLPKVRTETTWVPWTHRRLTRRSGYGAGIAAPGWYAHLFAAPDRPVERWLTKVAGLLREEDQPVSSAHVIEAVRLAGALAAMRGRPLAGLTETTDAVRAVMGDGSDVPLALVHDRLVVGDVRGEVPDRVPAVPLQRDLTRLQRTLRLRPEASERDLDLDLRKETDAARSRLLHRLRLLGVDWGTPAVPRTGSTGTFRESWRLSWEPELHVRVAEAGVWGGTVLSAATAKARAEAAAATALAEVTALAERCLLAELPEALPPVMRALADRAALDTDVGRLAQALPALARSLRYGDVRATDTAALAEVATGLARRIFVGLPPACAGLDADAADEMRGHVDAVHAAIRLLPRTAAPGAVPEASPGPGASHIPGTVPTPAASPVLIASPASGGAPAGTGDGDDRDGPSGAEGVGGGWAAVLRRLAGRDAVPGVIRGRAARLLLDDGRLAQDEAGRLMGLALSPGTPPADAAAWLEGFLGGAPGRGGRGRDRSGGLLLVHDERLLALVDAWLAAVPAGAFTDVLPLLRRTFSAYEPGVRRTLGELVRRGPAAGGGPPPVATGTPGFGAGHDEARADGVLPVLELLLGRRQPTDDDLVGVGR